MARSGRSALRPLSRAAGFTMVELIVVIVIIGILASMALPRLADSSAMDGRGYASVVTAEIRYAQKLAIAQRRVVCAVPVAGPPQRVDLIYAAGGACAGAAVTQPGNTLPYQETAPNGIAVAFSGPLAFNGLGQPADPAGNALAAPVTVNITGVLALTVEQETGHVR